MVKNDTRYQLLKLQAMLLEHVDHTENQLPDVDAIITTYCDDYCLEVKVPTLGTLRVIPGKKSDGTVHGCDIIVGGTVQQHSIGRVINSLNDDYTFSAEEVYRVIISRMNRSADTLRITLIKKLCGLLDHASELDQKPVGIQEFIYNPTRVATVTYNASLQARIVFRRSIAGSKSKLYVLDARVGSKQVFGSTTDFTSCDVLWDFFDHIKRFSDLDIVVDTAGKPNLESELVSRSWRMGGGKERWM